MEGEIVNKVSQSKIFSFDMEEHLPAKENILVFDLADFLFQGLVIREKDFRTSLKELDWSIYAEKYVWVLCSADAIVPIWAYMLVATYLSDQKAVFSTSEEDLYLSALRKTIAELAIYTSFEDRPVIVKGCSNIPFKENLYLEASKLFLPLAKSIMYGEPCSTVPIYKKR